jgi:hypothetical protein
MKPYLPLAALLIIASVLPAFAGDSSVQASSATATTPDTRYGPFNLFDQRSNYGEGVYPEPFLVDDSDEEKGEFRLDWLHTAGAGASHTDLFTTEIEKGFGVVTVELEVPIERDVTPGSPRVSGFDNINPGIRAPFHEYVSPDGVINTTFGAAFEAGIPTHSQLSKNVELVPKIFNDIAVGSHLTLQSILGYSMLRGPHSTEGGLDTFEYGFVLGWTIQHNELAIPGVEQVIPVFEVQGEKELNQGNAAVNSLFGNAAIRVNTRAIGGIQPRLGLGFVFPMTNAARDDSHWGIYTSLVFEF